MTRNYKLTAVFDDGSWGSVAEPVICEYPTILDAEFFRYGRAIRCDATLKTMKERGVGRVTEAKDSADAVEVWAQAVTYLELDQILAQIRSIVIAYTVGTYQSVWIEGDAQIASKKDRFFTKFLLKGYKTGMILEVPS